MHQAENTRGVARLQRCLLVGFFLTAGLGALVSGLDRGAEPGTELLLASLVPLGWFVATTREPWKTILGRAYLVDPGPGLVPAPQRTVRRHPGAVHRYGGRRRPPVAGLHRPAAPGVAFRQRRRLWIRPHRGRR